MKHTPGPWYVGRDSVGTLRVFAAREEIVRALSTHGARRLSKKERIANAHLIAASPKMLAALEKVAEFIRHEYSCLDPEEGRYIDKTAEPIWCVLCEAIADARSGESDKP